MEPATSAGVRWRCAPSGPASRRILTPPQWSSASLARGRPQVGCTRGRHRAKTHKVGYLGGNVLLRYKGLLHYPGEGSYAPCSGDYGYQYGCPSGNRLKAARGRVGIHALRRRYPRVGLIGVPVLAGSAAYALSETSGWRSGLERKVEDAYGFYGVIAVSVLLGLVIQYSPISPMKALFWSAVIQRHRRVPLMVVIILLASKKS